MSDATPRVTGVDTDIDMLCAQIAALRELEQNQAKEPNSNRVYAFGIRWGAMIFGRLERLDHYSRKGALSSGEQQRYDSLLAELRELLPVMDELGVARPNVSLDGSPAR